jgi:hypothetical protein
MPLAYQVLAIRIFHFYHGAKIRKNKITTKFLDFFLYNLFKIRKFSILSYGNLLTLSLSTGVGRCLHDVNAGWNSQNHSLLSRLVWTIII